MADHLAIDAGLAVGDAAEASVVRLFPSTVEVTAHLETAGNADERLNNRVAVGRNSCNHRSVGDLLNIVALLESKKVSLRVLSMSGSQPLDTGTATGRLMLAVIGAVGQAERETMLERQREGIAKAQREGKYRGRTPMVRRRADEIIRLKDAGVIPTVIAGRMGIGRASVYRVLAAQTRDDRQKRSPSMIGSKVEDAIRQHLDAGHGIIKVAEIVGKREMVVRAPTNRLSDSNVESVS